MGNKIFAVILAATLTTAALASPSTPLEITASAASTSAENDFLQYPVSEWEENVTLASGYNENYVIDIKGNENANNTPAQIYPENGTDAQIFDIVYRSDEYYSIVQSSTNKVLDVAGGVTYATFVNLYEYNGTDAQLWKFIPTGETGKYMIKSKLGLYLTVTAIGGSVDNTRLCTYERQERLNAAQTFTIKTANISSNKSTVDPVAKATEIFIHQTPSHCTAAAAAMLLKNFARINNYPEWRSINERTIRTGQRTPSDTWQNGLLPSIKLDRPGKSYDKLRIEEYKLTGSASEKRAYIKKLLESHPEGVVLYGSTNRDHAVYMAANMKILDPAYDNSGKYIDLSQSASSCSDSWSDITNYWIIIH